jgi:hypothetical protein
MKKIIVLALVSLFSTSLLANAMLSVDTTIVEGYAVIEATNVSGVNLECDYTVNWRTSLLDFHRSWGTVKIEDTKTEMIVIEDPKLPIVKATAHFKCHAI